MLRYLILIYSVTFFILLSFSQSAASEDKLTVQLDKVRQEENPRHIDNGIQFDSMNAYVRITNQSFVTSDGGLTWQTIHLKNNNDFVERDSNRFYYFNNFNGFVLYGVNTYMFVKAGNTAILEKYDSKPVNICLYSKLGFLNNLSTLKISKTSDGGITWKEIQTNKIWFTRIIAFDAISESKIIASVSVFDPKLTKHYLAKTEDGGKTWKKICNTSDIDDDYLVTHIYFLNDKVGWVSSDRDNGLFQTTDGGHSWHKVKTPAAERTIGAIFFLDKKRGRIIGGPSDKIYETIDGGANWIMLTDEKVLSPEFTEYFKGYSLDRWNDFALERTILFGRQKITQQQRKTEDSR